MYLSWSAFYEGPSDALYFNVLVPRLIEDILLREGIRPCDVGTTPAVEFGRTSRNFENTAREICERSQEFHILFIHSDLGGRNLQGTIRQRREALLQQVLGFCEFDVQRAVMLSPVKELEAWALADIRAVESALGVNDLSEANFPSSPREAERLEDPKKTLDGIVQSISKRRKKPSQLLVRIAQDQDLGVLRRAPSFAEFESNLVVALRNSGFISAN